MPKQIELAVIMGHCPTQHSIGAWRHERAYRGFTYSVPEFWERVGRTLEMARIGFLLLADQYGAYDVYEGSHEAAAVHAVQFPIHDPTPLAPIIARATSNLGIALTLSTTYLPCYHVARLLSTLDHITCGRIAWNIVTSYGRNAAANFGFAQEMPKAERYERADEYVTVCKRLWNSWSQGAVKADRETGLFLEPQSTHKIFHKGKHLSVEGPFSVPPMEHGHPMLIQAGASREGVDFACRHAEIHFATGASREAALEHIGRLEARSNDLLGAAVRRPRVMWGASISIGLTHREAEEKDHYLRSLVPLRAALAQMSGDLGIDLSGLPLDIPFSMISSSSQADGIHGVADMLNREYGNSTLRQVAELFGVGMGGFRFIGTPEHVVDQMLGIVDEAGGEGFILRCGVLPGTLDDFADLLVPELQKRRRFRQNYSSPCLRKRLLHEH